MFTKLGQIIAVALAINVGVQIPVAAKTPEPTNWPAVLDQARGQTVYWHAWGGDPRINDFIEWLGETAEARHGVRVQQVKLASTSDAVTRVLSERAAGQDSGGAVDLICINGGNFAAMKSADLLFGPFAEALPNWRYVDVVGKPAVANDFTVPTDGLESPWAMAQLVFEHDSARLPNPPRSSAALLEWARANPGRFTFPQPPDYLGTTFLKQILIGVIGDARVLQAPVDPAQYTAQVAPLWRYLDDLTPHLWRSGRAFPANEPALAQLLADGEIALSFAFNPGRASAAIADGQLPDTVRSFVWQGGTIGNASFVAIPCNAAHQAGALVVANLLLDPEVQARAADPNVLGFQTVLNMDALDPVARARFDRLDLGIATLAPADLGPSLLEPHPSWMEQIAKVWSLRYGITQ